jgi:hypothetical protein
MYTHAEIEAISKENDDMRERLGAVGWLLDQQIAYMRDRKQIDAWALSFSENIYTVLHLPKEKWPKIKGWE